MKKVWFPAAWLSYFHKASDGFRGGGQDGEETTSLRGAQQRNFLFKKKTDSLVRNHDIFYTKVRRVALIAYRTLSAVLKSGLQTGTISVFTLYHT